MAARYLLTLLACLLVTRAFIHPAFASDAGAPDAVPLSPPGQTAPAQTTADQTAPGQPTLEPRGEPVEPRSRPAWRTPEPSSHDGSRWYGNQIVLVDGLGVGLFALGFIQESEHLAILGMASLALGAPMVHGAHGEGHKALLSLSLHVLLPVGGTAIAVYTKRCPSPPCDGPDFGRWFAGAGLGLLTAIVIDAAFLARTRPTRREPGSVSWAPHLGVTDSSVTAGLGGQF